MTTRRTPRAVVAGILALVAVVGLGASADADRKPLPTRAQVEAAKAAAARKAGDVGAIRAELVLAQARVETAAEKAEVAAETYNGARWQLQKATRVAAAATAAAAEASRKVVAQRAGIGALVAQSYQDGSELAGFTAYLGPGGPDDVVSRVGAVESATMALQGQYDEFVAASTLATVARKRADQAKRDQAALTRRAAASRDQAAAAADQAQEQAAALVVRRRQLIVELAAAEKVSVALAARRQDGLEAIARAKAQAAAEAKARAEAAAEAAAAAAAASSARPPRGGSSDDGQDPPPVSTSGAAAKAIAFARSQLGEMYQWAAAGPDRWDCSGLMMRAWAAAGVSLPHYSAAQYAQTRHIGLGDLRPGDLVFWGGSPDSIHHVAMYLGNGRIIHAPRTGKPVEIDSMYYWVPPSYFGRP